MNICLYGASSNAIDSIFIEKTELLGAEIGKRGHTMVYGGGANGVMGAAARGMTSANGTIIGVAPTFFEVDGVLYDKCTEFIPTTTMRERKQIMEDKADAFIMAPGGIGTFEEFFEILTLKQLCRHEKAIAVFNVDGYYDKLNSFLAESAALGFMNTESLKLYESFSEIEGLLDYLENYKPQKRNIGDFKKFGR